LNLDDDFGDDVDRDHDVGDGDGDVFQVPIWQVFFSAGKFSDKFLSYLSFSKNSSKNRDTGT
jgi:hypothetical protein